MRGESVTARTIQSSGGMLVQGVARFVYTWAIGRFIGAETLGDVSTLLSLMMYAGLLWPVGLSVAEIRYIPLAPMQGSALGILKRNFWVSSLILAVGTAVVAFVMGTAWYDTLIFAALVWAYCGYVFTRGALTGFGRLDRAAVHDLIGGIIGLAALAGVLFFNVPALLLLPLTLDYLYFTWRAWPTGEPGTNDLAAEVRSFTVFNSIAALATGGLLPATMVFVKATEDAFTAGIFAAALSVATPASMAAQALNQVLVPHYSVRAMSGDTTLRAAQAKILALSAAAFAIIFGIIMALARFVLVFLWDDTFAAGVAPMRILLAIVCVISMIASPSAYLVATGNQRVYARVWLVAFLVGTAVMIIASPTLGQYGAMLGYAVGAVGGAVATTVAAFVVPSKVAIAG